MVRRSAVALLLVAIAASCAGGDSSGGSRCDEACDRDDMCNLSGSSPFCNADCEDDTTALRDEFADPFFTCYAELRCDVDGTECEVDASQQVDRRTLDDEFQTACQTKHTECDEAFSSDFCFITHYYEADSVDAAVDCLALTCDAIGSCLLRELPFAPFDR